MYVPKLYIICIRMYTIHIMNLKINIWTLNFLFEYENCYSIFSNIIWVSNFWFEYDIFNLNLKIFIWSKNWYLNPKVIFSDPKISIWI
jgi:hypothetical protein